MVKNNIINLYESQFSVTSPDPDSEVIPGVKWGAIEAFPTPAYWAFQLLARHKEKGSINYKLGKTLKEEVGACLLGGHGIPANIGIAAFEHIKSLGAFEGQSPSEDKLLKWLKEPIKINDRYVRYRFAKQKAKYLAGSLRQIADEQAPLDSGKSLRNWLINLPGVGYKTASWIARNWLDANDVAILDIHILRAGILGGFFDPKMKVEKHYLELEEQFLKLSKGMNVAASELDALIWYEMMLSPRTVNRAMSASNLFPVKPQRNSARKSKQSQSNTRQFALGI